MPWTAADLPDQTGRTVVVTGATSGLGRVTARELARAGAHVVLTARDGTRGERTLAELTAEPGLRGSLEVRALDLADLASVRAFVAGLPGPVDVLVNNAGVMAVPLGRTADGFETQLGTNHLGHFALTLGLLPQVTDRVVTLSSVAHRTGSVDLTDLGWTRRRYSPWGAYGQSKLANLLFTLELQRRLQAAGSPVRALAAHPGYSATNLQRGFANPVVSAVGALVRRVVAQSEEQGALPQLYAATQDLPGGSYVGPDGMFESRGHPTLVGRTALASDPALAAALWQESERLTGATWPLG
ncbi:oxidoreductase [Auraticoccus monumenti]|uniref:NAD(P)-dependent dehydrogenase, short-chain alcohol dehydrogenase family n=1 Tax=Auraticoccus monumenti TaxID=675864 RepID=A0A1G7EDF5_9ACTN|nr:oxidoreductase [Auraticoccus monumenti]SDE61700.1 NAD(P)-dependent dehydrogenase, short-chain alcohol dehydrogenase family [Auraticoccus monumenti]